MTSEEIEARALKVSSIETEPMWEIALQLSRLVSLMEVSVGIKPSNSHIDEFYARPAWMKANEVKVPDSLEEVKREAVDPKSIQRMLWEQGKRVFSNMFENVTLEDMRDGNYLVHIYPAKKNYQITFRDWAKQLVPDGWVIMVHEPSQDKRI